MHNKFESCETEHKQVGCMYSMYCKVHGAVHVALVLVSLGVAKYLKRRDIFEMFIKIKSFFPFFF